MTAGCRKDRPLSHMTGEVIRIRTDQLAGPSRLLLIFRGGDVGTSAGIMSSGN